MPWSCFSSEMSLDGVDIAIVAHANVRLDLRSISPQERETLGETTLSDKVPV